MDVYWDEHSKKRRNLWPAVIAGLVLIAVAGGLLILIGGAA